jgi:hypothetical protein
VLARRSQLVQGVKKCLSVFQLDGDPVPMVSQINEGSSHLRIGSLVGNLHALHRV